MARKSKKSGADKKEIAASASAPARSPAIQRGEAMKADEARSYLEDRLVSERDATYRNRVRMNQEAALHDGIWNDEWTNAEPHLRHLSVNTFLKRGNLVAGLLLSQRISAAVSPATDATDADARADASAMDGALRHAQEYGKFRYRQAAVVRQAIKSGMSNMGLGVRPRRDFSTSGKLEPFYAMKDFRRVFHDSRVRDDLHNSMYVFDVQLIDAAMLMKRFEDHADDIKRYEQSYSLRSGVDEVAYQFSVRDEEYSSGRPLVGYGQAWWKEWTKRGMVIRTGEFVCGNDLGSIQWLTEPRNSAYGHKEFPIIPLYAAREDGTGLPYSPIIRPALGIEIALQAILRTMVDLASKRGAKVDSRATGHLDTKMERQQYLDEVTHQLSSENCVLYSDQNEGLQIMEFDKMVGQLHQVFSMLMNLSRESGAALDPSLLGGPSNVTAAVSLREKRDHAVLEMNDIFDSHDRMVEESGNQMLSNISAFYDYMDFGAHMGDDGTIKSWKSPRNLSGSETRLMYRVVPRERGDSASAELGKILAEVFKIMPPEQAAILAPVLFEVIGGVEVQKFRGMMTEALLSSGAPVPSSLLSEDQKKDAEAAKQNQAAERKQALELEYAEKTAEIKKTEAEAELKLAQAKKIMRETEMGPTNADAAETIAAQQSRIRQLEGEREIRPPVNGGAAAAAAQ